MKLSQSLKVLAASLFLFCTVQSLPARAQDPLRTCRTGVEEVSLPFGKSNPGLPMMAPKFIFLKAQGDRPALVVSLDQKLGLTSYDPDTFMPMKQVDLGMNLNPLPNQRQMNLEVIDSSIGNQRLVALRLATEIRIIDIDSGQTISQFSVTNSQPEQATGMTIVNSRQGTMIAVAKNQISKFGLENSFIEFFNFSGQSVRKIYFLRGPLNRQYVVDSKAAGIPNLLFRAYANDSRSVPQVSKISMLDDRTMVASVGPKWAIIDLNSLSTRWISGSPDLLQTVYSKELRKTVILTSTTEPGMKSLIRIYDSRTGVSIGAPKMVNGWIYSVVEKIDGTVQMIAWNLMQKTFIRNLNL